jgi:hypothetical protein
MMKLRESNRINRFSGDEVFFISLTSPREKSRN